MSRARRAAAAAAAMLVTLFPDPANAHAELQSADPEGGEVLDEAPETVTLTLTEPAAPQSRISVEDGCERDVTGDRSISESSVQITTDDPEPGRWRVEYRLISAVDGHVVDGRYRFSVSGEPDCPDGTHGGGTHDEDAAPEIPVEDGGGLPFVPIALGAVALVALALIVRTLGSR